jgi:hypothetical protein
MPHLFIEKGDRFGRPAVNFYSEDPDSACLRYLRSV